MEIFSRTIITRHGKQTIFTFADGRPIPQNTLVEKMPHEERMRYAQRYADLWEKAFDLEGWAAFEQSKRSAAIHEAGHVVIAEVNGYACEHSRICRVQRAWLGYTHSPGQLTGSEAGAENNIRQSRMNAAGYMAERLFMGERFRSGTAIDEEASVMLPVRWVAASQSRDPDDLLREVEAGVANTLLRHEGLVRQIALALEKASPLKLKGRKLEALTAPLKADLNESNALFNFDDLFAA